MTSVAQERRYTKFSPDLPSVATMAAVEVDNLIAERETTLSHLEELSSILIESFGSFSGEEGIQQRLMLDPVSTSVISKAFIHSGAELQTYSDLFEATKVLYKQLESIESGGDRKQEALERLKEFCLALARYALASSESIDDIFDLRSSGFRR